jgi:ADP-ribose pyrophosphatase YjhB (NUDIX family)
VERSAITVRFCPVCASRLELRSLGDYADAHHPVCVECGFTLWQNPKPVVDALVLRDRGDQVDLLLGRRTSEPARGQWDTPGGFVDIGDRLEEVVRRECQREFGVDVEVGEMIGAFDDDFQGTQVVTIVYMCRYVSGQPQPLGPPVSDVRWFPLDELPPIAVPVIEQAIERLRNLRT